MEEFSNIDANDKLTLVEVQDLVSLIDNSVKKKKKNSVKSK